MKWNPDLNFWHLCSLAVFSLIALSLVNCNGQFYHPSREEYRTPALATINYEDHSFYSADSLKLHGRFFPRSDTNLPAKGLVLLFHGNAENLGTHAWQFMWMTLAQYDYFIFDYRGYGRSEGEAGREGLFLDGRAALEYALRTFPTARETGMVVVGQSLGGAVMIPALATWENKDFVSLAIHDCSFASYRRIARRVLANHPVTWLAQPLVWILLSGDYEPEDYVSRLDSVPLLVSTCGRDRIVPAINGKELFEVSKGKSNYWHYDNCAHTGFFNRPVNRQRLLKLLDSLAEVRVPAESP